MVSETFDRSPTQPRSMLHGVLMDAAKTVPEAKRTPSFMACLAEKILTVAAKGEQDPLRIRRVALGRVRESCPGCRACESFHAAGSISGHHLPRG